MEVTRRGFLMAMGGAALMLAGCSQEEPEEEPMDPQEMADDITEYMQTAEFTAFFDGLKVFAENAPTVASGPYDAYLSSCDGFGEACTTLMQMDLGDVPEGAWDVHQLMAESAGEYAQADSLLHAAAHATDADDQADLFDEAQPHIRAGADAMNEAAEMMGDVAEDASESA